MINYKGKKYVCYLDLAMEFIKSKWKVVLICQLQKRPKRFLELQRILPGISQKILNEKLKELENDGIIIKTIYPEVPPKVEFKLSEKGKDLLPVIDLLEKWAIKYHPKN